MQKNESELEQQAKNVEILLFAEEKDEQKIVQLYLKDSTIFVVGNFYHIYHSEILKRALLEKVELKTSKFEAETEILLKASRLGFKIESVPIKTVYRGEKSQINPFFDTIRFLKFIIRSGRN